MNKPAYSREKPTDYFIARINKAKEVLRGTKWRDRFLELNPAWNNVIDLDFLDRVYLLRSTDVFVTEELERIAVEFSSPNTEDSGKE